MQGVFVINVGNMFVVTGKMSLSADTASVFYTHTATFGIAQADEVNAGRS